MLLGFSPQIIPVSIPKLRTSWVGMYPVILGSICTNMKKIQASVKLSIKLQPVGCVMAEVTNSHSKSQLRAPSWIQSTHSPYPTCQWGWRATKQKVLSLKRVIENVPLKPKRLKGRSYIPLRGLSAFFSYSSEHVFNLCILRSISVQGNKRT